MKNLLSGSLYKWLAITVSYIIAIRVLDYILDASTIFSFTDAGFFAFVTLWCAQQDKIKREGNDKTNKTTIND